MSEIEKESDFRKIATVIRAYKTGDKIFAKDCKDKAEFVAEGAIIPVYEGAGDFKEIAIGSHKLASIVTLDEDFVSDAGFNIERYLTEKLGKCFGKAEDNIGFDDAEEELKLMEEFRKAQAEIEKKNEKPMSQKMFKAI